MPYGDLEKMRVQRFATLADIDASDPTVEEREEYEAPVAMGMVMYAGVDYGDILRQAEEEADVVIWDGGNNDFPFYAPDLKIRPQTHPEARQIASLWGLAKNGRRAECVLVEHPMGCELRVLLNEDLALSQAYALEAAAREAASLHRADFIALGWAVPAPQP